MKTQEIKFKGSSRSYSIFIGNNAFNLLPKQIKKVCPKVKKIALIVDSKVLNKVKGLIKNKLKNYDLLILPFSASEKNKSLKKVNFYLNIMLSKNFNRTDLIIGIGGGITGDVAGFVASIFKRGINFINIPTTLLAQVDSSIGGKTGVNSSQGKNLIGSFYQPRLVISDTTFLNSLSKKEMICGYAEILKHSLIKDKNFFNWLKKNTENIFKKKSKELTYAIKKSCQIKMYFVNKDVYEKDLRMILNFGHTFAHAIEVKNNYSKKVTHGEAVLSGMILALRISFIKRICNLKTVNEIKQVYKNNNLNYTYKKYSNQNLINSLIPHLKNDKKNNDNKVNFILLKKIGQTTLPNKYKISINNLKALSKTIAQY
jgi:3-dehydroquinate synthase